MDQAPGSQQRFIRPANRLAHYRAEEEKLIADWLERTAYGEMVPSLDGEGLGRWEAVDGIAIWRPVPHSHNMIVLTKDICPSPRDSAIGM